MKRKIRFLLVLPASLLQVSCGSIPDVVVDAAKESAKETIEQRIDELLAEFGDQIDLSMLFPSAAPQSE